VNIKKNIRENMHVMRLHMDANLAREKLSTTLTLQESEEYDIQFVPQVLAGCGIKVGLRVYRAYRVRYRFANFSRNTEAVAPPLPKHDKEAYEFMVYEQFLI
jgi:hypothetical protein